MQWIKLIGQNTSKQKAIKYYDKVEDLDLFSKLWNYTEFLQKGFFNNYKLCPHGMI